MQFLKVDVDEMRRKKEEEGGREEKVGRDVDAAVIWATCPAWPDGHPEAGLGDSS